ncbi:hypothetical protein [Mangrovimonas sp. YM274]|uniref:hypothetical protein n=1 Tax=Mangrovimonas sp. YM274 TaxID=3070660 RepID=UPI0027DE33B3|nr:hypothetical protein [Mangrovimonas sp. YM274]WMI68184.1 hypothetical protein RBH95_13645 [Mangrovimonas sp. YM274]
MYEKNERKIVENKYSVLIPEYLTKTTGLNQYTDFEYENIKKDFYIIIMDESKDGFYKSVERKKYDVTPNINGYYEVIKNHFKNETNLKEFKVSDEIFELDKAEKKITFTMTGIDVTDNYPIYYRYSIIESKTRYYQIMSWTNQTNASKMIVDMNKIINSFRIEEKK